ncbi:hypothetical protein BCR39DRAFT_549569 [Naematelia encephala]|uniref:Sister chromatid cohesion protein n=1 Tax=Naematelia encephala TaxID=71784 RepID=A0A1Y2AMU5_9TREE|nr:hypothetical protein BCR39DRAFT_549569 [Naematelia encephala]
MSDPNHHHSQNTPQAASASTLAPSSAPGGVYQDPRSLLSCFPFALYQPIARTALHISPHTTVYPTPATSTDLYPQYADVFSRIDNPQTAEDWAARTEAEMQVRGMLDTATSSYSTQYCPSPLDNTSAQPSYGPPGHQGPPPIPYSFLANYMTPSTSSQQPPTPSSLADAETSLSASVSNDDYFEAFVDRSLRRAEARQAASSPVSSAHPTPGPPSSSHSTPGPSHPTPGPSSATSTPTISRTLARTVLTPGESPDPLSLSGPSPSKRRKAQRNGNASPTKKTKGLPGHTDQSLLDFRQTNGSSSSHPSHSKKKQGRPILVVEVPVRRRPSQRLSQGSSEMAAKSNVAEESDEDGLEWGDDVMDQDGDRMMEEKPFQGSSPRPLGSTIPPGSGRTGERDTRTHFQRLQTFLEDVFEESDSFPAEPSFDEVNGSKFFISSNKEGRPPVLSTDTMEKIIRYIRRVHSSKRRHSVDGDEAVWDVDGIGRLLQLLERSMRDAEGMNIFTSDRKPSTEAGPVNKGTRKKKAEGRKSKSPMEDTETKFSPTDDGKLDEDTLRTCEQKLATNAAGARAAEACMVILNSDGLPKQVLSEDILTTAVTIIKDGLHGVLLPVIAAISGDKIASKYLDHLQRAGNLEDKKGKPTGAASLLQQPNIALIARSCCSAVPHLTSLLKRTDVAFSDSLVIQTVYLALSPLFIAEPTVKKSKKKESAAVASESGLSVIKALRMEALACLRAVFTRYEEQRQWIVEEILGSVVNVSDQSKAQTRYQLPNGTSIHTLSALLLQIIQASAFGVSDRIRKLRSNAIDQRPVAGDEEEKIDVAERESQLCVESIESALRSARVVAGYLVQKSSSNRGDKSSHDADYKAVLDIFVADLLAVLYRPEWPAASLYLSVISRLFISALDDPKSDSAPKNTALEYLGSIAARLRTLHIDMLAIPSVESLDGIISHPDPDMLSALLRAHATIRSYLAASARSDAMFSGSLEISSILWAQELQQGIKKAVSIIDRLSAERSEEAQATREKLQVICQQLRSALQGVFAIDDGLFEVNNSAEAEAAVIASLAVSRGQSLQGAFDPILHALIAAMNTTQVHLRSKALRGLTGVVTVDSTVLGLPSVRQVIEDRLSDGSPQVRDAAVELVGKYIARQPELIADYYPHIVLRVNDTGLGVRKRVVKLLRDIYLASSSRDTKIDICTKLIFLVGDNDESVKELATATLADIIFPPGTPRIDESANLLVEIIGEWQETSDALQRAVEEIGKLCEAADRGTRFAETIDALLGKLVDATEQPDFDALSHIRAVQLLSWSRPRLIDLPKASILLTYLRHPPSNGDEQATNDLLLRIFCRSIPHMPRTASSFASDLSRVLMPMINKPTGGLQGLKEIIGCFCILVNHLTKDYVGLLRILKACEGKIRVMRNEWTAKQTSSLAASPAAPMMLYITALIAEHCNLDAQAEESDSLKQDLQKITGDQPLYQHLYDTFLDFTEMPISQAAPTVCLGSLFKACPDFILADKTTAWINRVFASNDPDNQARVLTVICEFLHAESDKKAMLDGNEKTLGALIGGTADLHDAGLSTLVVQRNIEHILYGARSQHPPTQNAALDVLAFTVNQGLYHPLQCLPILVSLETSDTPEVAERALALHATLHSKHSSHMNVRYLDFARHSYEYQRQITSEPSGERDGVALLAGWYALVSEKKQSRNDFLRGLGRAFDYDISRKDVPNVGFALYIAENLIALEYRLQEEVMAVVQQLGQVVSGCQDLASILETAQLAGEPSEEISGRMLVINQEGDSVDAEVAIHCSIVVGLAILAKNHLLDMYSLSEE